MKKQIIFLLLMAITLSSIGQITATASSTDEFCGQSNGTATVTPAGSCSYGYTYLWDTSPQQTTQTVVNLPAGTYTVTVSCGAETCSASAIVSNIAGPSCQIIGIVNDSNGQCNGTISSNAIGGTAPYNYSWSNGENVATVTGLCAGTYTVTITDANGCTCENVATITNASSIYEMNNNYDITIFPNPTSGVFSIDLSNLNEKDLSIELTNSIGQTVPKENIIFTSNQTMTIDISALPKSIYYLKIYNRKIILNKKILKE